MRALDLFCGAGGVTRGLQCAGFHVTGVDIAPQPNYVGEEFHQADAVSFDLRGYDFIWASPPCQAFTAYKRRPGHVRPRENLIPFMRYKLELHAGVKWVIENVHGAPLQNPVMLCGSMFSLDVRRHRYFETGGFTILAPACRHDRQTPRFPPATNRKNKRCTVEVGVWRIPLETQREAMGIDWMTLPELSQAIPPSYSWFIGRELARTATKAEAPRR